MYTAFTMSLNDAPSGFSACTENFYLTVGSKQEEGHQRQSDATLFIDDPDRSIQAQIKEVNEEMQEVDDGIFFGEVKEVCDPQLTRDVQALYPRALPSGQDMYFGQTINTQRHWPFGFWMHHRYAMGRALAA